MQIINLKDPESYRDIRGFTCKLSCLNDALKIEKLLLATPLRVERYSHKEHMVDENAFNKYRDPILFCFKYPEHWLVGICNADNAGAPKGYTIRLETDTQRMLKFARSQHVGR